MLPAVIVSRGNTMSRNVGRVDQYARIVLGLALVAYAFQNGLPGVQRAGDVNL
jgi:hypothetical protein